MRDNARSNTTIFVQGAHHQYSILGALTLYLDFINLFLMLLRIFGNRR
jgi:FtsH-binding integral membrane protein